MCESVKSVAIKERLSTRCGQSCDLLLEDKPTVNFIKYNVFIVIFFLLHSNIFVGIV